MARPSGFCDADMSQVVESTQTVLYLILFWKANYGLLVKLTPKLLNDACLPMLVPPTLSSINVLEYKDSEK